MEDTKNTLTGEIVAEEQKDTSLVYLNLANDERSVVDDYISKIDIHDNECLINFGSEAQSQLTEFSDTILTKVKTTETGEIGNLLASLVGEIKTMSTEEKPTGIRALFAKAKASAEKTVAKFDNVENNVDKIVDVLNVHKDKLTTDIKVMDEMFDKNVDYFKQLSFYIIAGEEKLKDLRENIIPELQKKAAETGDQQDAQKVNDMLSMVNRFEKKVYDLKLTRTISLQMGPQIRLIQNNDTILVEKIQSSILNTIPLWKSQMIIYLGLANVKKAVEAQKAVSDITNELLTKNSEMLKTGTIDVAKESERGIIDMETIKKTNADIIETIDTVIAIQKEGYDNRKAAEKELEVMESELKNRMLAGSNG